jgi:excinuclease ABC subunit A
MGPGAGEHGGQVVATGTAASLAARPNESLTGLHLAGLAGVPIPKARQTGKPGISIRGARANNLKGVDADFPKGCLTVVTGVSGSGKSSLVMEVLLRAAKRGIGRSRRKDPPTGPFDGIDGLRRFRYVVAVDQSPIGRTPRSNPATYSGVMGKLRAVFAKVPEARAQGFDAGRFSFNVARGRCGTCDGQGALKIEMHFLSDVWITCEACKGHRYNAATLSVRYRNRTIADCLEIEVAEAKDLFKHHKGIQRMCTAMVDVGLGYLKLGQPATTLSGGEAQRLKLATELAKPGGADTLYVLDEPTTGLHPADVEKLVHVLLRLRDKGAAVVVIEHNLDVAKVADRIIDLGPEGGEAGGEVLAVGTPEELSALDGSHTGLHLRWVL